MAPFHDWLIFCNTDVLEFRGTDRYFFAYLPYMNFRLSAGFSTYLPRAELLFSALPDGLVVKNSN